ncbi:MAG: DUF4012 domain-containing protein [Patescibacteria group bacterium]
MLRAKPALPRRWRERLFQAAIVLVLALVAMALVATVFAYPFYRAGKSLLSHVEAGRSDLAAAESYASQLMVGDALHRLELAQVEFDAAQRELTRLKPLAFVPYVGEKISVAENLLTGGLTAVSAVREALLAVQDVLELAAEGEQLTGTIMENVPVSETAFSELTPEKKRSILAALDRNSARLASAVTQIDEALFALDQVPDEALNAELFAALQASKMKLRSVRSALASLAVVAEHLPTFLGYPESRRYLIFFQNNTELRPTGGFLGVYGVVNVQDAEMFSVQTDDIYTLDGPSESVDRPAPPAPIAKYINIDKWYLRDANWSPDFPTSAAVMEQFYYQEAAVAGIDAPEVDGIVAITPQLAADLLRIVGPITIGDKTFDADNLVDELEFAVEVSFREEGIPFFARKSIVGDLVDELMNRLTALPLTRLVVVLQTLERNLTESHAFLWMKDKNLQAFLLEHNWGGQLQPAAGDYFSVIDANLAAFKTDAVMSRDIAYSISPRADGGYDGRVAVTYRHSGGFDWKTTRYRTYTRLYVPTGAELIAVDGALVNDRIKDPAQRPGTADVFQELGRTVFGAFISIEPGQTRQLVFSYKLPESVAAEIRVGSYSLYAEKQPGTTAHGLTLDLNFGKNLTSALPSEDPSQFGDTHYIYSTDLRVDREFSVGL